MIDLKWFLNPEIYHHQILNPNQDPKSSFQILNPKPNLTIKFISSSAFQILSNYLQTTKFDFQTTNLTKFFYHNFVGSRYTNIDWEAYMHECAPFVEQFETDYSSLRGPTGPIAYPAGYKNFGHKFLWLEINIGQILTIW